MPPPFATSPGTEFNAVSPIEIPGWDRLIASFSDASAFHGTGWARTLVQSYGHRPAYLLWPSPTGPAGVLPLMGVRGLSGRYSGVSLPFTDACPPLLKRGAALTLRTMLDAATVHGRSAGWNTIELRCRDSTLFPIPSITHWSHVLDLTIGKDGLFENCRPAVRRAIRRARDEGVAVDFPDGVPAIEDYFQLHCLTRRRHGLPPQPWRFFCALAENLIDGRSGFVARARAGSKTVAAAVFLIAGDRAIYKFGASDQGFQQLRANNLVIWEAIARLAGQGIKTLDFGRTAMSNEGLRRFKLGWGSTESRLCYYRIKVCDGSEIPITEQTTGWHTAVFRRLPVPVLRWIGSALYRFQT